MAHRFLRLGIHPVTAFKKDIWARAKPNAAGNKPSASEAARLNQAYQKIFPAFQEAINAKDTDKIQSFLTTYMAETLVAAWTMERLISQAKGMYQKTGGIALDPARPSTSKPVRPLLKERTWEIHFR